MSLNISDGSGRVTLCANPATPQKGLFWISQVSGFWAKTATYFSTSRAASFLRSYFWSLRPFATGGNRAEESAIWSVRVFGGGRSGVEREEAEDVRLKVWSSWDEGGLLLRRVMCSQSSRNTIAAAI